MKQLALSIALSVLAYIFAGALMFTSGYMISLAAALPLTVLALHLPSLFVRVFGIGKPALRYAERLTSHNWVLAYTSNLRRKLYDALEAKSYALRSHKRLGGILELLTDDITSVQNMFLRSLLPMVSAWILAGILVAALGALSLPLAGAMLCLMALTTVLLPYICLALSRKSLAQAKGCTSALYESLADNIYGVSDWILSGNKANYIKRIQGLQARKHLADATLRRIQRASSVVSQFLFCACVLALLLWAGSTFASGANAGGIVAAIASVGNENAPAYAPNWVAAFALCFFPLIEAFAGMSKAAVSLKSERFAWGRLQEFMGEDKAIANDVSRETSTPQASTLQTSTPQASTATSAATSAATPSADIEICELSFSYTEDAPILRNVNLLIPQGQKLALLGKSGAGKTTMAALIHGDYAPTIGVIRIAGTPPANFGDKIHNIVGIVQQRPYLFNDTLRANLQIAKAQASDDELMAALRAVKLDKLVQALPDGLGTKLGEDAARFSGGEAQRIALARVLLAKTPIVILDEPFTSLDAQTENDLLHTMLSALADKTVIAITHHLQNIDEFDRVIFLEKLEASGEASGTSYAEEGAVNSAEEGAANSAEEGAASTTAESIKLDGSPAELKNTSPYFRKLLELES